MQEFTQLFDTLLKTNAVNFLIMLAILIVIIKKLKLSEVLEKSITGIRNEIQKSDNSKNIAQKHLRQAKETVENLPQEIKEMETISANKAQAFTQNIENNTLETVKKIGENAIQSVEIEEKKISNILTEETVKNSTEKARDNIIRMLKQNPTLHDKFIQNSIDELDRVKI